MGANIPLLVFVASVLSLPLLYIAITFIVSRRRNQKFAPDFLSLFALLLFSIMIAAIYAPNFLRARAAGGALPCQSHLKTIVSALRMYSADNGGRYPPSLEYLTRSGNYLRSIPSCPSGPAPYSYAVSTKPDAFTVNCTGVNYHAAQRMETGFPQYSSNQGLIER